MNAFAAQTALPAAPAGGRTSSSSLHLRSRAMERPLGPFADRCAMLLDPSLMEKARAAASELHGELEKIASRTLANALKAK
jgi:hypothetical protein